MSTRYPDDWRVCSYLLGVILMAISVGFMWGGWYGLFLLGLGLVIGTSL